VAARQRDVSLAELLGGQRKQVATGISIGIQKDPAALVERALRALSDGYRKIKIKIQPGADVEYARAVRRALPPSTELMADANSAYTTETAGNLTALDELNLLMIEQPLHRDDLLRHAQLQRTLRTPICLDESITDVARCEDMIALGSGRIVNIKPGRVGGYTVARRIHDVCSRHSIPVWCGGMLESGVGRAYNVALASLPNFSLPGDLSPSARYWERDIVTPEWTMDSKGMVTVPRGSAGIGVSVDRDRVEDLTVRSEELKA
jgi:O-succinylbenzoate synthase